MSDVRLQIKIKSSRIMRAMEAVGIYSVAELCRVMGMPGSDTQVGKLINMKCSPVNKGGKWRPVALALATALHKEPDFLWPEYLRRVELKSNEVRVDMTMDEFQKLASNPNHLLRDMTVQEALAQLPARERQVLELRFGLNGNGEHTVAEVAKLLTRQDGRKEPLVSGRIIQIEARALRRLRSLNYRDYIGLSQEDIT
jgi:DNA-directed RNA polymerase sigma subunit (sigma70/sigma32)